MKSVRIGAGLGFYGDAWEPIAASIERGGVQFIASDHLAELTLAILQKDRQRDPSLGYARDVVPLLLRLWPLMQRHGVRFVCNAGGLNPHGAAQAVLAALALVPVSLVPGLQSADLAGMVYALAAATLGLAQLGVAMWFFLATSELSARWLMRASLVYLPALLALLMLVPWI